MAKLIASGGQVDMLNTAFMGEVEAAIPPGDVLIELHLAFVPPLFGVVVGALDLALSPVGANAELVGDVVKVTYVKSGGDSPAIGRTVTLVPLIPIVLVIIALSAVFLVMNEWKIFVAGIAVGGLAIMALLILLN